MAIIPEPTANRIFVVSGGYVYAEISTRGRNAAIHAGSHHFDIERGRSRS